MRRLLVTSFAAAFLLAVISSSSPVNTSKIPTSKLPLDIRQAKLNIRRDIDRAGISKEATLQDLKDKVLPILAKYHDHNLVSRAAFAHLQDRIGVNEETMERFRCHRDVMSHRKSAKQWSENCKAVALGIKNASTPYKRKTKRWSVPSKVAWNKRRAEQRLAMGGYELQELSQKLEKLGLQDETDYDVLLQREHEFQGEMSKRKLTFLLGEYMKRTKGILDWSDGYSAQRNRVKTREKQRTARQVVSSAIGKTLVRGKNYLDEAGAAGAHIKPEDAIEEDSMPDGSPFRASVRSSRPNRRHRVVMSDPEMEDNDLKPGQSLPLPVVWPRKQRSGGRKPKVTIHVLPSLTPSSTARLARHVNSAAQQKERLSGRKRISASSRLWSDQVAKRPTTGGKSYTGCGKQIISPEVGTPEYTLHRPRPDFGAKTYKGAAKGQERPTIGQKRYTGPARRPQTASLAPKISNAAPP